MSLKYNTCLKCSGEAIYPEVLCLDCAREEDEDDRDSYYDTVEEQRGER